MKRRNFLQLTSAVPLCLAAESAFAKRAVEIFGIRRWVSPERTRLVLDLNRKATFKVKKYANGKKIILILDGARPILRLDAKTPKDPRLKTIQTRFLNQGKKFEIALSLKRTVDPQAFLLPPNESYKHRLVLDLYDPKQPELWNTRPQPSQHSRRRELVIAIDAGHGGEDPGAVGHRGTKEKTVVLQIAQQLNQLIRKERGMRPIMIRNDDYYVSLGRRTRKARQHGADLFLSIHADGFHKKSAHGASVYILSDKRASSEMARWLAKQENRADRFGGVNQKSEGHLNHALRRMEQSSNRRASRDIGKTLLHQLDRVGDLHGNHGVQEAGFAVLKSTADFPSLLVETGFITNPGEEQKLRSATHQKKLAEAMMRGIRVFAQKYPVGVTQKIPPNVHIVAPGENLSQIAELHGISVKKLKKLNKTRKRGDLLYVGQKLRLR